MKGPRPIGRGLNIFSWLDAASVYLGHTTLLMLQIFRNDHRVIMPVFGINLDSRDTALGYHYGKCREAA